MLSRLEITNYKSIAYANLDIHKENILVGQNGAGKSNLVDAINFLRDAANDGLDHAVTKRHGINSIRRWSKTRPFNISLKLSFVRGENSGEYKLVIASSGGAFSVVEEEGNWYGFHSLLSEEKTTMCSFRRGTDGQTIFDIPDNPFKNSNKISTPDSEIVVSQFGPSAFSPFSFFFSALYEELTSSGAYSIYPNRIREPQSVSNSDVLSDDGSNLASIIRQMRATTYRMSKESLTLAVQQVLPIVSEIRIETAGGFFVPVFRVQDAENGHAHDLNMSQISDGTLRMLGMLTAFYQPKAPRRITLEEPEQMVHPGLLPILVDAARDYLDNDSMGRQVLITTHSPTLLDMFRPEDIVGTKFEDGVSTFMRLSHRQLDIVRKRLFTPGELLVTEGLVQ